MLSLQGAARASWCVAHHLGGASLTSDSSRFEIQAGIWRVAAVSSQAAIADRIAAHRRQGGWAPGNAPPQPQTPPGPPPPRAPYRRQHYCCCMYPSQAAVRLLLLLLLLVCCCCCCCPFFHRRQWG